MLPNAVPMAQTCTIPGVAGPASPMACPLPATASPVMPECKKSLPLYEKPASTSSWLMWSTCGGPVGRGAGGLDQ